MRFRFNAPPHHSLIFGPEDDPLLVVHGGEEYDHPEGFSVPRQSVAVDEVEAPDPDPDPDPDPAGNTSWTYGSASSASGFEGDES